MLLKIGAMSDLFSAHYHNPILQWNHIGWFISPESFSIPQLKQSSLKRIERIWKLEKMFWFHLSHLSTKQPCFWGYPLNNQGGKWRALIFEPPNMRASNVEAWKTWWTWWKYKHYQYLIPEEACLQSRHVWKTGISLEKLDQIRVTVKSFWEDQYQVWYWKRLTVRV